MMIHRFPALVLVATLLGAPVLSGCGSGARSDEDFGGLPGYSFPIETGKFEILGIRTDNKDHVRAKQNAEDTISRYPDIAGMVGLWAYNPPAILSAIEGAGRKGKIAVVGFDEDPDTLKAVADGDIHGTIAQQPFVFGFKSVEFLAAMVRNQPVDIPDSGIITVPVTIVTQDNVREFSQNVERMRNGQGTPPEPAREYDTSDRVRVAFVTNSVDPFWNLAREGCKLAEEAFNAECLFHMPPTGTVDEQKQFVETLISRRFQGLAISPIDARNQADLINEACESMVVICQDSDAPGTNRKFYLGTSNYMAGREAGKLVKEAMPEGGKIMIFVGKMEVLNAQERARGVIDELMDKPIPEEFAGHQAL